jgi:hypothetical protein
VLLPLFVFGSTIWFFLASSVAGMRHPGEDRSTPLKIWAAAVSPTSVAAAAIPIALTYPAMPGVTRAGVVMTVLAGLLGLFIGLTFANEPPLPPRARTQTTWLRSLLSVVGPGAAGTTRFALAAAMLPPLGVAGVAFLARHAASPNLPLGDEGDAALFVVGCGNALVIAAFTGLAMVFRLWSRNGIVARLLTLVTLATAVLVPVLLSLVMEPNVFDYGRRLPPFLALSPIGPLWAGVLLTDRAPFESTILAFLGLAGYGGVALALWVGIEAHVLRVRRADEARRAEQGATSAVPSAAPTAGAAG